MLQSVSICCIELLGTKVTMIVIFHLLSRQRIRKKETLSNYNHLVGFQFQNLSTARNPDRVVTCRYVQIHYFIVWPLLCDLPFPPYFLAYSRF